MSAQSMAQHSAEVQERMALEDKVETLADLVAKYMTDLAVAETERDRWRDKAMHWRSVIAADLASQGDGEAGPAHADPLRAPAPSPDGGAS